MNIYDSTGPMRRKLEVHGQVISIGNCRSLRCFAWKLSSLYGLFCWALVVTILLLMVSGCGRYKEELEDAKQQIETLRSEVKKLSEDAARLEQEKSRLTDESNTLSEKNTKMQREVDDLNKAKAALSAENEEMKKKNSVAEEEIASLKREKARLTQEIEELKRRVAETTPPPKSPAPTSAEVGPRSEKHKELSPCDAVVAFMNASEGIVRQQKGTERTRLLEQVEKQYTPRMRGAPEKAIKAAKDWVKEGAKFWDQSHGERVLRLLRLRSTVLEACGKSPNGAGFK